MKRKILCLLVTVSLLILTACSSKESIKPINNETNKKGNVSSQATPNVKTTTEPKVSISPQPTPDNGSKNSEVNEMSKSILLMQDIKNKYINSIPNQWGEKVDGVISRIDTKEKIIALTFDACGEGAGKAYDSKLISYLIKENIPATLFINARWIDANPATFKMLAENELFEIENHGYEHKPLSVNGKSAYNIKGTNNIDEIINEVYKNEQKIQELTGRKPKYFRSGTAYYDEVAVKIVKELGEKPVNFNIIGDAGATFSPDQIKNASLAAGNGSIIIYHMNHPEKGTADGIIQTIPSLKEKGFRFVKLENYDKYLK